MPPAPLSSSGRQGAAHLSVERQPYYVARAVTAIAVSRLRKSIGQLPLLRFVAPLRGRMRENVIRLTLRADGGGPSPLPTKDDPRLLARTEWIEK